MLVELALSEGADADDAREVNAQIEAWKAAHIASITNNLEALLEAQQPDAARDVLVQLVALGLEQQKIVEYRQAIEDVRRYGPYRPGQVRTDSLPAHEDFRLEWVVIPQGQFMMGSGNNELGRQDHEGPRHRVVIPRGFALGRTEVTVAQFAAFVSSTGYRTDAERRGRARVYDPRTRRITEQQDIHWRLNYLGRRALPEEPVVHVSWHDAQAYLAWLSRQTGKNYRLPTEAEFEYALRAGSQWTYHWGPDLPSAVVENLAGEGDRSPSGSKWGVSFPDYSDGHWGPAPVGQFRPNAMGLYDMGGNVMEWTEDCWHDSYVRAPANGSAWVNPGCTQRVVRGGSWAATPVLARSAFRKSMNATDTDVRVGFRVARDL